MTSDDAQETRHLRFVFERPRRSRCALGAAIDGRRADDLPRQDLD